MTKDRLSTLKQLNAILSIEIAHEDPTVTQIVNELRSRVSEIVGTSVVTLGEAHGFISTSFQTARDDDGGREPAPTGKDRALEALKKYGPLTKQQMIDDGCGSRTALSYAISELRKEGLVENTGKVGRAKLWRLVRTQGS